MHIILSYLKFLFKSKNQHGVHSPFVFDLVTKCFYDNTQFSEYQIIKEYRKSLLENKNYIDITDFGAGSRVFKSNKRQISKIAKTAGISQNRAKLLFRFIKYFQPQTILEIGTSLGLSTISMSLGNKKAKIVSLEGCPQTLNQCHLQLKKFNINNIDLINTEFSTYLQSTVHGPQPATYNLVYLDGNHSQHATLHYFDALLPNISNETILIFDDIHWSKDMEQAWEIIKKHPKVTVTIDTFHWGIVFFRTQQAKEHFLIRT